MHVQWFASWLAILTFVSSATAQDLGKRKISNAIGESHHVIDDNNGDLSVQVSANIDDGLDRLASLSPELRGRITRLVIRDISADEVDWDLLTALPSITSLSAGNLFEEVPQKWNPHLGRNLQNLEKLQFLYCANIELNSQAMRDIGNCVSIEWLFLGSCNLAKADLAPLGNLKNLRQLKLNDAEIEDGQLLFLGGLAQLKWLDLSGNDITDAAIGTLAIPKNEPLESLFLEDTKLTPKGFMQLRKLMPDCGVIGGVP